MTDDEAAFAARLLRENREELQKADAKANIVLAAAGVVVGALLAGLIAGDVSLKEESVCVWVLTLAAGCALLGGVGLAGAAVYPRIGKPERSRLRYFAEITQHDDDLDALRAALKKESVRGLDRDVHQLYRLSRLVQMKYRLTQTAMWALGAGFVLAGVASLVAETT